MADVMGEAVESLRTVEALRNRTRLERSGHWFVLVVFGIVTLGAMPFYWSPLASPASPVASAAPPGCRAALQSGFACVVGSPGTPLGGALNPQPVGFALNRWATVYWSVAVLVGFATIVLYYRRPRGLWVCRVGCGRRLQRELACWPRLCS